MVSETDIKRDSRRDCAVLMPITSKFIWTHFKRSFNSHFRNSKENIVNIKKYFQGDEESVEKLIVQAKQAFGNDNVVAADDLMILSVPRR